MNRLILAIGLLVAATAVQADEHSNCPAPEGVALQVLGSGGPMADDARSSSSYIIWVDGQSRAIIDVGTGSFLRFGEAGADFSELDFIGLSHFHSDHSADFIGLLKTGFFVGRERPLAVAGPAAGGPFPGLHDYLAANLNKESGAYRYLGGYLDGTGGLAQLVPFQIDGESYSGVNLLDDMESGLSVYAQPVPHGIVPATGFRIDVRGFSIVFASDQNGTDPAFAEFAKDATVLVMHMPIPEGAGEPATLLHAIPSKIGEVAAATDARWLLLSHFMARSLADLDGNVALVKESFDGELLLAEDLMCVSFD